MAEYRHSITARQYSKRVFANHPFLILSSYVLYYLMVTIMASSCFVFTSGALYVITLTSFQYLLLADYVDSQLTIQHQTIYSINNVHYQEEIQRNLRQCCIYQKRIDMGVERIFKYMSPIMLTAIVTGGISILIAFYIVITGINPPNTGFKMKFGVVAISYMLVTFIVLGQGYSNASMEVYNRLCECSWYYWNVQNRRTYLVMLANTNELKINAFGLLSVDFPFLVEISRFWYNILCFISNYRYTLTFEGATVSGT
ncbi:unnamed protein product [Acanthoscelides obtectus]|uniref:Odorant receptor n=1 Tax=Acanthoscelides obtectus TaxID=200917 RepID=A0A9P0L9Z4_ACAOB|nr:unnamed protein product [Acanthoscelides obtectus]CAK1653287.1 hypothetical protein AOBTE_LOCUS18182 [Acanthoscelides obtectus]